VTTRCRPVASRGKRLMDVLGAVTALIAGGPLLVLAAIAILMDDGRPVWFLQRRAGLGGRPFVVRKLRTMRVNTLSVAEVGQVDPSHALVTPVGRFARRLRLDELPQMLNVLAGDMSLVGPRPAMPEDAEAYGTFERRRLETRPGVTGWAQVNGNVKLTWPQRIMMDVWYIDHWSIWLDVRILLRTMTVVVQGERIDEAALRKAEDHAKRVHRDG
jgi:lipopolysaccharide/colanic/teichoic acid biosynthesis glycosyltransferase